MPTANGQRQSLHTLVKVGWNRAIPRLYVVGFLLIYWRNVYPNLVILTGMYQGLSISCSASYFEQTPPVTTQTRNVDLQASLIAPTFARQPIRL